MYGRMYKSFLTDDCRRIGDKSDYVMFTRMEPYGECTNSIVIGICCFRVVAAVDIDVTDVVL